MYENGKIYKMVSHQTEKVYVGSTCQTLSRRFGKHKSDYNVHSLNKKSSAFEIVQYDDADIILLESFPCKSKEELHAKEREYIEKLDCVNKVIPTRTRKEYDDANKDKKQKSDKKYYENNKTNVLEKKKEYYKKNKEDIDTYKKAWYEKNKAKILEKHQETYTCECGVSYSLGHKSRHEKSKKHLSFIN
jgi:hypothetical protein